MPSGACMVAALLIWLSQLVLDVLAGGSCRSFHGNSCLLEHEQGSASQQQLTCGIETDCEFDVSETFGACPIYSTGSFKQKDSAACQAVASGLPCTKGSCCNQRYAPLDGHFRGFLNNSYRFVSHDCPIAELSTDQAIQCLRQRNARLVLVGDSMMRQLFVSAVHFLRGQQRILDPEFHNHASYLLEHTSDHLQVAAPPIEKTEDHWIAAVDQLVSHSAEQRHHRSGIVRMDYLWAPKLANQIPILDKFHRAVLGEASQQHQQWKFQERLYYMLFIGFWEQEASELPTEWQQQVEQLSASAARVYLVTTPIVRLFDPEGKQAVHQRNTALRTWAASNSAPDNIVLLDFEALAEAAGAPPGLENLNWHYSCSLNRAERYDPNYSSMIGWPAPFERQVKLNSISVTEDGECFDEMNRWVLELCFNDLCSE